MKTLKFRQTLADQILAGDKTTTWRLFDDKNLSKGDQLSFLVWKTQKEFAQAKIVSVKTTKFGKLTAKDWTGHETFDSPQQMYDTYSGYYQQTVDENTPVTVIKFKLLS